MLGDVGSNSPGHWEWGGWDANRRIDGLLLLYARSHDSLCRLVKCEMERMSGIDLLPSGFKECPLVLRGRIYDGSKEHFGFKDGISQPVISGTKRAESEGKISYRQARISLVKPGEFIIGYLNERRSRTSYSVNCDSARGGAFSAPIKARQRDISRIKAA